METEWRVGELIQNHWELLKEPIRGGMGIVYILCDHEDEARLPFAAKTFREEVFTRNPGIADLFINEALIWTKIDVHENVTKANIVIPIEGKPFLFLEYVSGGDLSAWVGTPRLTEDLPQVLRFAIQFCDGMSHALSKGIEAHRDIKPQNCLITGDGVLKVTDFGLARVIASDEKRGGRGGTYAYMAPEQWESFAAVDMRADIYSFGIMLFQMNTGKLPFVGRTQGEYELLHKTQPVRRSDLHPSLRPVVDGCLAKRREDRFADFGTIRDLLADIYKKVTGKVAASPATGPELTALQWNNKATSLDNLGRTEDSFAYFDRALELDPSLAEAWSNKGVALVRLGRMEEAYVCFVRALEVNPQLERQEVVWSNFGLLLAKIEQFDEALVVLDRAISINPNHAEAWANKALALGRLERFADALACYTRALEIYPRFDQAWYDKGALLGELGATEHALACFDRALEMNSRHTKAWYNRGVALTYLGQTAEALVCFDQTINLDPRHARAWFNRGVTLGNFLRYREALTCFQEADELGFPDAPQAIQMCLRHLGR